MPTCTHPFHAFKTGGLTDTGKTEYYFDLYRRQSIGVEELHKHGINSSYPLTDFIEIPCGKCLACKQNRASRIANRALAESFFYPIESIFFITITYGDWCCPKYLDPRHMTLYLKRLRKSFGEFRYFYCGEYGEKTDRPHYHLLAYGLRLDDLKPYGSSSKRFPLFTSKKLQDKWSYGLVWVQQVSDVRSVGSYVASYMLKNANPNLKGFQRWSRRPGLGYRFFEAEQEEGRLSKKVYLPTGSGDVVLVNPPKFVKDKLDLKTDPKLERSMLLDLYGSMRAAGFKYFDSAAIDEFRESQTYCLASKLIKKE